MKRIAFTLLLAAAVACSAEHSPDMVEQSYPEVEHGMIVLGEQLEDPYSVENVTKALASLYPTKAGTTVSTTHLYVRFLPKDEAQLDTLQNRGLEMMDHPMDFSIVREGDYYHDPEVDEGDITWQYAVVPPDFEFPEGIKYEILDRCHIAEQPLATRSDDGIDWEAVEREAFRLTGNSHMLEETRAGESSSSTPEGRITIVDSMKGGEPIGVAGVKVSCNVFVKTAHAFTDADGYYKMNTAFNTRPRYRLVFKNKRGFGIGLNLILCPASVSTLGRQPESGYSITVDDSSDRALFRRCAVNNAAWDYYAQCTSDSGSINEPPSNVRIWLCDLLKCSSTVMFQQGVMIDGSIVESYMGKYYPLLKMILPDITLGLKDCPDYASIYATTVHELAHASHYMQVGNNWWKTLEEYILKSFLSSGFVAYGVGTEENHGYCEVAEMWAYYMQTRLFRERYPDSETAFGTSFWFHPQVFNYMDGHGLTCYLTFNALTADVCDKNALRDKLLRLYPDARSIIYSAFDSYK